MNTGRSIDNQKGPRKKNKEVKVTIIGKDNNVTSARFSRASVESDDEPEEKEQPMLLQQKAETVSDNVLLYNVFYNKEQKEEVSPIRKFMSSLSKDNMDQKGEIIENVVKLEIDINELKKYAPLLSPSSSKDLQLLANEITNSIQVNHTGQVLINKGKINPNAVRVQEKSLKLAKFDNENTQEIKRNDKRKVLLKTTKFYGERKFLLIITHIERVSNLNKLILAHEGNDQVYEEFDIFFEISAIGLSENIKYSWELPLGECERYSGESNPQTIAKFFTNKIYIFADQIVLSCPFKIYTQSKNFLIMYEGAIRSVQRKFRVKKFIRGFNRFRKSVEDNKADIIGRRLAELSGIQCHLLAFLKKEKIIIQAWESEDFSKYELVIISQPLEKYLHTDKKKTSEKIFLALSLEASKAGQSLNIKEKLLFDGLAKEFNL